MRALFGSLVLVVVGYGVAALTSTPPGVVTQGAAVVVLSCVSALSWWAADREPPRSTTWLAWRVFTGVYAVAALICVVDRRVLEPGTGAGLVFADWLVLVYVPLALVVLLGILRASVPPWRSARWSDAGVTASAALAFGASLLGWLEPSRTWVGYVVLGFGILQVFLSALVIGTVALIRARPARTVLWFVVGLDLVQISMTLRLDRLGAGHLWAGPQLIAVYLAGIAVVALATRPLGRAPARLERRRGQHEPTSADDLVAVAVAVCLGLLLLDASGIPIGAPAHLLCVVCLGLAVVRLTLLNRSMRGRSGRSLPDMRAGLQRLDTLTGLADRTSLSAALARGSANGRGGSARRRSAAEVAAGPDPMRWSRWTDRLALLLVDLDRFKDVNEALGLEGGDEVLAAVGTRLREVLRPTQLIARLGGDEFAVVLPGAGLEPAIRVAEALRAALEDPIEVATPAGTQEVFIQASIGVATCRLPQGDPADLLRQADVAVHRAKQNGRGIEEFDPRRDRRGTLRLRRIAELRSALEHGDIEMHLQPQVHLATGRVVGSEALARWRHPKDGVLLPAAFLPLAAQTGLMRPVAAVAMESALAACARVWEAGHEIPVSVNLSAADVLDSDLTDRIPGWLAAAGLPPEALRVEITEDVFLTDAPAVARVLSDWRRFGIGVALDDYGTGYSSLAYLRDLHVDELKLDQGFAADLARRRTATIVRHTVAMAHGLGIRVVAEGVETRDTARQLADLGCDIGQGLYFGPAMAPDSFISHLAGLTVR